MLSIFPDFYADLVPGKSAAGFTLGESFLDVSKKVGAVEWYGPGVPVRDILLKNRFWIGIKRRIGFGDEVLLSYRFMNEAVSLYFESSGKLYRIAVGGGYRGRFNNVCIGDDLRDMEEGYDILFNDEDDDFLLKTNGSILMGVSFVTRHRAPLEEIPEQTIEFISIHDWSLR
nr:hypothetical protein [uncultured Pseudomonas sp.]